MKIIQHNDNKASSNLTIRHVYEQLEKDPKNVGLNVAMAYLNRKSGSLEHALFFCKNALSIDAYDYHALYEQARIFELQNSYTLACKNYQIIYSHHKNEYEYLQNWCQCLIHLANKKYTDKFETICIDILNKFKDTNDLATIICYEQLELINSTKLNYFCLKELYLKTKQYNKAEKIILADLNRNPNSAAHLVNYAAFLHDTDRLNEAVIACNKAIKIDPNYYYSYDRLSFILKELNDPIGSKNAILKCLDLNSTDSSLFHLATTELLLGNYETGWQLYKHHNAVAKPTTPHFVPEILFDGTQNLKDKVLCVWLDLGLGDALKFVRYIPMLAQMVREQGGTMICSIFSEFNNLFHKNYSNFFTEIANRFYKPYEEFDYQIQVSRFPELFKTTLETIPNKIPYLQPSEQAIVKHKDILKHDKNFKVGLVWAGNKHHSRDHLRSIPVDSYIPFKNIDNISFYGFQFGKPEDIEYARNKGLNIIDLTPNIKNFDESAVIFQQLDLLITVDTSACHLAGALGVPTWLLVDIAPHYIWLLNRDDSPWYPNTTLYRQTEYKNWQPILQKMHEDLTAKVEQHTLLNQKQNNLQLQLNQTKVINKNNITTIYNLSIVITTMCRLSLIRAVRSIFLQSYLGSIQILIGIDTDDNKNFLIIKEILDNECPKNISIVWLNLGYSTSKIHGGIHSGYSGGSLRTALSMLANSELVMYLDDNDWLHRNHISNILSIIGDNAWAFAYSIYADSNKGIGICIDELESVGIDKGIFAKAHGGFVRTSGLLINKIKLMHILYLWSFANKNDNEDEENRLIFDKLRFEPHACTGTPSIYYTLNPKDSMHSIRMEYIQNSFKEKTNNKLNIVE
jgi:tetratricopeptide (TPR) repeat protein